MVSNKQGWLLLVVILGLHAAHCQEGNRKPFCWWPRRGIDEYKQFFCRDVTSFANITRTLPTYPPVFEFRMEYSPNVQFTSTDFNHTAFKTTTNVEIEYCNVSTINPEPFTYLPRLTSLTFQHNPLTEISSSSFLGLEHLEQIILDDNQIASVAADTFKNLHNLTRVNLRNNKIASLADNMFENQRKLTHLYLGQNQIAVVNDNTFKGLVQLEQLHLDYNRIESISPGAFTELTQLQYLYLGYNNLQSLPPALFQTNTRLQYLDLSGNNLANLANFPLNIPSLEILSLNNGTIHSIPVDYFANLRNVSSLSLTRNKLSRFEDVLLEGLPKLYYLNLDSNKFTSFNLTAFRELNPTNPASLERMKIDNNPWNCREPIAKDMINLCRGRWTVF